MPYMVTWIPSIYPLYVSVYTSTMDPSWVIENWTSFVVAEEIKPRPSNMASHFERHPTD